MQPRTADGGRAGLEALDEAVRRGHPFSLVLLDLNMPDLDGFAVAREIARRPELAGATIMMLSSSAIDGEISRCRELGIAACLTKPVKGPDLFDAICRTLDARTGTFIPPSIMAP